MNEQFFGSLPNPPMWPSNPYQGFGFVQPPLGLGSRPYGIGTEGFAAPNPPAASIASIPTTGQSFAPHTGFSGPSSPYAWTMQPYGFGGVTTPASVGTAFVQGIPAVGQSPFGHIAGFGGFPGFPGFEVPPGVTAPALLTAVAMRRGQPLGPTNDHEIEEFIYEALDLVPGTNDVELKSEGGRVTLTGTVPQKRLKRDVGEIAWALQGVNDVVNNVNIAPRRRSRGREGEGSQTPSGRK